MFMFLFYVFWNLSDQKCLFPFEENPEFCCYCGLDSSSVEIFSRPTCEFRSSSCIDKDNFSSIYIRNIFVIESAKQNNTLSSDGSLEKPYQSLSEAFSIESFAAAQFKETILVFFLGSLQYFLSAIDGETINNHFRDLKANISIEPAYCIHYSILQNCIASEQKPTIFFKSEKIKFYIGGSLTLRNIILNGIDMNFETRGELCNVCCNETLLVEDYSDANRCGIKNQELTPYNGEITALFNLEGIYLSENKFSSPELLIENCEVINFNFVDRGYINKLNTIVKLSNYFKNIITITNLTTSNSVFAYFMFLANSELTSGNMQYDSFLEKNSLQSNLNLSMEGLCLFDFNKLKLISQSSNTKSLFFLNNIRGTIQLKNCLFYKIYTSIEEQWSLFYVRVAFTPPSSVWSMKTNISLKNCSFIEIASEILLALFSDKASIVPEITLDLVLKDNSNSKTVQLFYITNITMKIWLRGSLPSFCLICFSYSKIFLKESKMHALQTQENKQFQSTLFYSESQYQVSYREQFNDVKRSGEKMAIDELVIENSSFTESNVQLSFVYNVRSIYTFILRNSVIADISFGPSLFCFLSVENQFTLISSQFLRIQTENHFIYVAPSYQILIKDSLFKDIIIINGALIICRSIIVANDNHYFNWSNVEFRNIFFQLKNLDVYLKLGEGTKLALVVLRYELTGDGMNLNMENTLFTDIKMILPNDFFIFLHVNSPKAIISNVTILNITKSVIFFYLSTVSKGILMFNNIFCHLGDFLTNGFLKTSAEFFELVNFNNVSATASNISDTEFIHINNVNNFMMAKSIFRVNLMNGGLLNLRVLSLKNFYIANSVFKNLPFENRNTRGVTLGTKNISEDIGFLKKVNKYLLIGISNCSFEYFDDSALIIEQNSVMYLNGIYISGGVSDFGSAIELQTGSSLVLDSFFFKNLSAFTAATVLFAQTGQIIFLNGIISDSISYKGGGTVVALDSTIQLEKISFFDLKARSGGALLVESCELVLVSCSFYNGTAEKNGGFISIKFGRLVMMETNLTKGQAGAKGGCVLSEESGIYIIKSNFDESSVLKTGVLMMMGGEDTKAFLIHCRFSNNYAKSSPALAIIDMKLYAFEIKIKKNKGVDKLIEVFSSFASTMLIINNFTIEENHIIEGYLLYAHHCDLNFFYGNFKNNNIGLDHIYLADNYLVHIFNLNFEAMVASNQYNSRNLGFLNSQSKILVIINSNFSCETTISGVRATNTPIVFLLNCTVAKGFAIYGSGLKLSNSNFLGDKVSILNSLTATRGSLYAEDYSLLIFKDCVFAFNKVLASADVTPISDIFLKNSEDSRTLDGKLSSAILINNIFSNISSVSFYAELTNLIIINVLVSSESNNSRFISGINCLNVTFNKLYLERIYGLGGLSFETLSKRTSITDIIIKGSVFNYVNNYRSGGALYIMGAVNVFIDSTTFSSCGSSWDGGAIYYYCFGRVDCNLTIVYHTIFIFNQALGKGGALFTKFAHINYNNDEVVLQKNVATIGNDFASSPYSLLMFEGISQESLRAKILNKTSLMDTKITSSSYFEKKLGSPIKLSILVIDFFKNIIDDLDEAIFQIRIINAPSDSSPELINNLALLVKGVAYFEGLEFKAKYSEFVLEASIESIKPLSGVMIKEKMQVYLNSCEIGDIFTGSSCKQCPAGFFSLNPSPLQKNISECIVCPPKANCDKGIINSVAPGSWRINNLSEIIVSCTNEIACPSSDRNKPSSCGPGYFGNFCGYCAKGYVFISSSCERCYEGRMLVGFLLPYIFFFCFIALSRGDVNSEQPTSELRFMSNSMISHLSYLMIIGMFDLDLELDVQDILSLFAYYITPSSQNIFSFGCFMSSVGPKEVFTSMILTMLSPILYLTVFLFQMELVILIKNFMIKKGLLRSTLGSSTFSSFKRFRKDLKLYFFLIFFNLYPTLIIQILKYLNCVEIQPGISFLEISPEIPCSTENSEYVIFQTLAAFGFLLWGLGIPFLIFIIARKQTRKEQLFKNDTQRATVKIQRLPFKISDEANARIGVNSPSNNPPLTDSSGTSTGSKSRMRGSTSNKSSIKSTLGTFLITGYTKKFYFWESLIYIRKFFIILVSLLRRHLDPRSLAGVIITVFFLFFIVNQKNDVFTMKILKNLETASLITMILTLGFGLLASYDTGFQILKRVYLSSIFVVNVLFFLLWITYLWKLRIKEIVKRFGIWRISRNLYRK